MKTILIIGGSTGIGRALTQILAEKNYSVIATFHKTQPDFNHPNIVYESLDVLNMPNELSFLPEKLDGLVYCPGAINLKPFHRIKSEEFLQDYRLQVLGAIESIQRALPKLNESQSASIVLFSTVAVQVGFKFHSMVSASKGALEGLTHALASEYSPKIRVNCVAPSLTDTPLASKLLNTDEKRHANANRHPLQRIGTPEDIANSAEFLLSDASNWMTGQILHVDGGISNLKA